MSGDAPRDSFSKDRAELFEALGHPTRIRILELLANSPMGFSDLKKALDIDSGGQLQFHLGKLHGLVKTVEGNYTLTDEGKEALRMMAAKEPVKIEPKTKHSITPRRKRRYAIIITAIIAAVAIIGALSFFVAAAYAPLTINIKSSAPFLESGDQQQHFSWEITGHIPGQSFQTLQFSVDEYINGNFTMGYGDATNSSVVQTDVFGNFFIGDPIVLTSIPANYSIDITLVSKDGAVIEKTINIPANYTLGQILG
jgi:DNA-binding transcriptional ArsR family regulator